MDETLLKKLKLDKFTDVAMMKPAQEEETAFDGYGFPTEVAEKLELGLVYVYSLEEMKNIILQASAQHLLVENGQLYLFYPKNKNKLGHAPIHRDHIFPYLEVTDEMAMSRAQPTSSIEWWRLMTTTPWWQSNSNQKQRLSQAVDRQPE